MPKTIIFQEPATGINHIVILPCVIGRGAEADLCLSDLAVSHRHALVEERDGQIWVHDLGSTNGVFVNDVRIREKTPLQAGDVIRLGERGNRVRSWILKSKQLPAFSNQQNDVYR